MGFKAEKNYLLNFPPVREFLLSANLTDFERTTLETTVIERVEVNPAEKTWLLYIKSPVYISRELLDSTEAFICANLPQLRQVQIELVECGRIELDELIQKYRTDLLVKPFTNLPMVQNWLEAGDWQVEDERLIISLPNEVVSQYCHNRKINFKIQELIKRYASVDLPVEFTVCPMNYEETEEFVFEEYLAGIESSQPLDPVPARPAAEGGKGQVIMGRPIKSEPVALKDLVEEEKRVTVAGRIFNFQLKELRSGRKLITFDLTDNTDSISVKIFDSEKGELSSQDRLKNNIYIKIRGNVQFDKYTQELTLLPQDIELFEFNPKRDLAPEKRIELHAHTKMSAMDGVIGVKDLIKRASDWGHPAVAITDHGVVQAFPDAYEAGKKYGVKIIYGVEGYLIDDLANPTTPWRELKSYHIIILVKNKTGLHNLYRLISQSHLHYYHRRPRIPKSLLIKYREGLLLGSACEAGELIQAYLNKADDQQLIKIAEFYDYLEIQPTGNNQFLVRQGRLNNMKDLQDINLTVCRIGRLVGKPVAATGDIHFLDPEDEVFRRILMAAKGFEDADEQAPLYFRTTEEMLEEFSYLGDDAYEVVVTNTQKIASLIEEIKPIPDELYPPKIDGADEQIIEMTYARAKELYGENLPETVAKRIEKELNSIITNGFAVLYLIAHKLVTKSNADGYLVGSRGSVGSSFVATMTGITEVNPLPPHYLCPSCKYSEFISDGSVGSGADLPDKNCPRCEAGLHKDGHDIPFEVFLGFKGDKVPDIDLNFSGEYQSRAHKYSEELFGKEFVFRAGTIATVAEKTAFGYVKNYLDEKGIKARTPEISRLVAGCTGVKRTTGQHPGGLMVVPRDMDIHDFSPVQRPADDVNSDIITTHFDYHAISSRLVKLDILGHDDPTVIKMLEDLTGVDAKKIPLDETKTMSLFSGVEALGIRPEDINSQVGTLGIPEFGTRFVRQMLEETRPKTFSELVRISGFSHGTDVWLNNAQDLIKAGVAKLSECISARDDIMSYLIYKGVEPGLAFKIMESVRKGQGVKPEEQDAMRKRQVPEWYIESCNKIKYMFPKAHAVAYVMMAFRIAYFKVYYPEAFYAAYFTVRADEFDADLICQGPQAVKRQIELIERKGNQASPKEKNLLPILEIALEFYCRGLKMLKVDLARSESTKFVITSGGLLPPLASLQGVGKTAAQNIVAARTENQFISIEDLRIRAKVSKAVIEALANHGCLKGLAETSQMVLFA